MSQSIHYCDCGVQIWNPLSKCPICEAKSDDTEKCEQCRGRGWYPWFDRFEEVTDQISCEICYGTGRVWKGQL